MVTTEKDAEIQLYISLFSKLTSDAALASYLVPNLDSPKVYQTWPDLDVMGALSDSQWLTFNIVHDSPMDAEQTQDIREITFDVHVWERGPGSIISDKIEKRIRQVLDNGDLATEDLFVYFCHNFGYNKTYEASLELWHVISSYHIACVSLS